MIMEQYSNDRFMKSAFKLKQRFYFLQVNFIKKKIKKEKIHFSTFSIHFK